jgi:hypothetical protein
VQTRITLTTSWKGSQSVAEYYTKMRSYADELATSDHPLGDEEFVSYILAGLNEDFDPMVSAVIAHVEPISPTELYSQMLSHELCHNCQSTDGHNGSYSSANAAIRGHGGPGRGGRGHGGQRSSSNYNSNPRSSTTHSADPSASWPKCQTCLRMGHTTNICWYRYDEDYVLDPKTAAAATTSHGADPQWHLDSGATDHITSELDKLTMHDCYHGTDQVRTPNDTGMHMNRIGTSIIPTPSCALHLHNILHVPRTHKHLISIHCFNLHNHTFIELHAYFLLIKDQVTKKVLLHRPCKRGFIPFCPPFHPTFRSMPLSSSSCRLIGGTIDWAFPLQI